jgi:sulfur carrier protein ThiS
LSEPTLKKARVYTVGQRSKLLQDNITEIEFQGNSVSSLLHSVGSADGATLYDEVVAEDGSFAHGYAIAVNGELIRCDELDKRELPSSSDVVVIHLVQIPAGG